MRQESAETAAAGNAPLHARGQQDNVSI